MNSLDKNLLDPKEKKSCFKTLVSFLAGAAAASAVCYYITKNTTVRLEEDVGQLRSYVGVCMDNSKIYSYLRGLDSRINQLSKRKMKSDIIELRGDTLILNGNTTYYRMADPQ